MPRRLAFDRLKEALARLEELGARVEGEVGDPDPRVAVRDVLADRSDFDEILVAATPTGIASWVGADLASQLRRDHDVVVTHVEAAPTGSTE